MATSVWSAGSLHCATCGCPKLSPCHCQEGRTGSLHSPGPSLPGSQPGAGVEAGGGCEEPGSDVGWLLQKGPGSPST